MEVFRAGYQYNPWPAIIQHLRSARGNLESTRMHKEQSGVKNSPKVKAAAAAWWTAASVACEAFQAELCRAVTPETDPHPMAPRKLPWVPRIDPEVLPEFLRLFGEWQLRERIARCEASGELLGRSAVPQPKAPTVLGLLRAAWDNVNKLKSEFYPWPPLRPEVEAAMEDLHLEPEVKPEAKAVAS